MQMIDLMKRLAELDAQNPNIVKENQIGTMGLDAYPDEIARMRKSREKMDKDTEWLLKNKPTDPCPKCGETTTYRDSYGTSQYMKCARCGKVRLSSDDIPQNQDMAEGSGPKEKQHDKYVDRTSPDSKAKVQAAKDKMAADKAAEPGKKLAAKIAAKEGLEECGMMGGMSSQPHSPASINMTAATGEELSAMLKDIMTLAGRPTDDMPMGEPMGGADGVAVVDMEPDHDVDVEPSPEVGADEPSIMRSMMDKLNPSDDSDNEPADDSGPADNEPSDDEDEEETDEAYDNSPQPETAGYGASVPSGNDLHKEKQQYPAAQPGDNAMSATYESLMADYRNFVAESEKGVAEVSIGKAAKAYKNMAAGDNPMKNRTGLAGDQSDRMKARMDKRWGKDAVDAEVSKSEKPANESLDILKLAGLR